MKKHIILLLFMAMALRSLAQTKEGTSATVSSLAVPASPAFSIVDITPTLVQNPSTPKSFVLGVAQSFQQSGTAFPNNYSAQIAPIWWIKPQAISIYSYLGLPKPEGNAPAQVRENPFAGLKFSTVSVAFINKDLIPDTAKATQNIFSIGVHSTLIKVYGQKHTDALSGKIAKWVTDVNKEFDMNSDEIIDAIGRLPSSDPPAVHQTKVDAILKNYKNDLTAADFKDISDLIAKKPIFAWDMAGAYAVYGTNNNQNTQTGRVGAWTSLALNLPLDTAASGSSYLNINALSRYMVDNFQKNDKGVIGRGNNFDVGGNLGFEFNKFSIAVESLYRFANGIANTQNRTVGTLSVKLNDTLFITGCFGKDFAGPNKLISIFGINWGFGKEKVALP